jgi:hypothetical protein
MNLYAEVEREGYSGPRRRLVIYHPEREPGDVPPTESCALDVAERGGITLEEVGSMMNVSRERIRQVEELALKRLGIAIRARELSEDLRPGRGSGVVVEADPDDYF